MSRRVNPIVLLGLIVVLILSLGILATAQSVGGGSNLLGIGEAQVGKPFRMSSAGPDAFSCAGLIHYILDQAGIDHNAPMVPEGYLGAYPSVAPGDEQPGDLIIYPDHATMYAGNGMVLNANEVEGKVTHTPMSVLGVPLGIVRPGGGGGKPPAGTPDPTVASKPTATDPTVTGNPTGNGNPAVDPGNVTPAVDPGNVTGVNNTLDIGGTNMGNGGTGIGSGGNTIETSGLNTGTDGTNMGAGGPNNIGSGGNIMGNGGTDIGSGGNTVGNGEPNIGTPAPF